jgi:hypothetical protein
MGLAIQSKIGDEMKWKRILFGKPKKKSVRRHYNRTVSAGLTKSQAEWEAATQRSMGKNARALRNIRDGTWSVWVD